MPTSTFKCTYCKERFPSGQRVKIISGTYCGYEHILNHVKVKEEERRQKQIARAYGNNSGRKKGKTKKDCDNDLKTRKEAAKTACHTYIRARDRLLYGYCICCDKPLGDNYHAGHWIPSGQNSQIRYDEDNIHGQRVDCNYFKGGDSGNYKYNLIKRIGIERTEALEKRKGGVMKRTCRDYLAIEQYYKQKLKDLNIRG